MLAAILILFLTDFPFQIVCVMDIVLAPKILINVTNHVSIIPRGNIVIDVPKDISGPR